MLAQSTKYALPDFVFMEQSFKIIWLLRVKWDHTNVSIHQMDMTIMQATFTCKQDIGFDFHKLKLFKKMCEFNFSYGAIFCFAFLYVQISGAKLCNVSATEYVKRGEWGPP